MAASGTTKKISINNILSSSPTATGAFSVTGLVTAGSATITGAATVGTTLGVTGVSTLTGNVGVGNAPSAWTLTAVQVGKGSIYGSGNETGYLGNAYYGSGGFKYIAAAGASFYQQNGGVHQWYTAAAGAAANDPVTTFTTAKMALSVAGDLSLASGNLIIGTSGKGIDFSAVTGGTGTATANVLNDYEEGTFTATLKGGTTDPTIAVTTTGKYTKIGRTVFVEIQFGNVSTVGASGTITITGLPFASHSSGSGQIGCLLADAIATFTNSSLSVYLPSSGSTTLSLYTSTSNASISAITHNAGTGKYLWTSITYHV